MDLLKESVKAGENISECFGENMTECELIIPDYMPEVLKIVCTHAVPRIKGKRIAGERLVVDGTVEFRVLYMSGERKGIKSMQHFCDFTHSFEAKDPNRVKYIMAKAKCEQANCRLVSPRKAMLKSLVGIACRTWGEKEISIAEKCSDNGVECLTKDLKVFNFSGIGEKHFNINEQIAVDNNISTDVIVDATASLCLDEVKAIQNKMFAKGTAYVDVLCAPDDEDVIYKVSKSIPFSQIIDVDGVDETTDCDVKFDVTDLTAVAREEGGEKAIEVSLTGVATGRGLKNQNFEAVVDAYSLECDSELDRKVMDFESVMDKMSASTHIKESLEMPSDMAMIISAKTTPTVTNVTQEGSNIRISGMLDVAVYGLNTEGEVMNINKQLPFVFSVPAKDVNLHMRCEIEVVPFNTDYSLSGNTLTYNTDLALAGVVYGQSKQDVVTNINLFTDRPRDTSDVPTLTLYYGSKGEKLWDIAKRYRAPCERLRSANLMDSDELSEDKMLIVPRKKRVAAEIKKTGGIFNG